MEGFGNFTTLSIHPRTRSLNLGSSVISFPQLSFIIFKKKKKKLNVMPLSI